MKQRSSLFRALLVVFGCQFLIGFIQVPLARPAQAVLPPPPQIVYSLYHIQDQSSVLKSFGLFSPVALKSPQTFSARVPSDQNPVDVAARMNQDSRVVAASANLTLGYSETRSSFNFDRSSFNFDGSSTEQALYLAHNQWAWQKTGLSSSQKANWGQGVKVAVLDTGVDYNHPELKGHVLSGYDAFRDLNDGRDVEGHGTFVAGIILQIAPQATIIPVRVLDENGVGSLATILNGLQYALEAGANIINLSLSSVSDLRALHHFIQVANSKGVLVVSAAGNDHSSLNYYPAAYQEGMGIASTDEIDYQTNFTNYNTYMSLSAPGVNIYSMWMGGGYG